MQAFVFNPMLSFTCNMHVENIKSECRENIKAIKQKKRYKTKPRKAILKNFHPELIKNDVKEKAKFPALKPIDKDILSLESISLDQFLDSFTVPSPSCFDIINRGCTPSIQ